MSIKIHYFGMHGRAEPIRMLLSHAKVEYEDLRFSFEEFGKAKAEGKYEFGQVPAVEVDGVMYVQSQAILRSLGQKYGYYSEDPITMYKIDSAIDGLADMFQFLVKAIWQSKGEEQEKLFSEAFSTVIPKFYAAFENRLKHNSSPMRMVGDKLTTADFAFAAFFYSSALNEHNPRHKQHLEILEKYPMLCAYAKDLGAHDLKEYLEKRAASPQ